MHIVTQTKLGCNANLGVIGIGDDDGDDDSDVDSLDDSGCDYVVALETDNTIEIISSEDGQLINVVSPELCREHLHRSLMRLGTSDSAATSSISVQSTVKDVKRRKRRQAERRAERKRMKAMDGAARRT